MASGKSLGFFAGDKKLYFVETNGSTLVRSVSIPLLSEDQENATAAADIRIIGLIQKVMRDERIGPSQVKFSIPTGETIIRSFLIPMMNASEIEAVVEFEIKKYIPFNLKDLAYDYNSLTVTENNVRKTRIVFVAVRRAFLERYAHILEQAGLPIVSSEPAPLSFVRLLLVKKIVTLLQKVAVLHVEGAVGRLLFIHEGMVIFMREFPLSSPVFADAAPEESGLKNRLINEVRNSLEFYNRQYAAQPIDQMVVVAPEAENYGQWLKEDLAIEIKSIEVQSIVSNQAPEDQVGVLNAFGAAAINEVKSKASFDLSRKKSSRSSSFLSGQPAFNIDWAQYAQAVKIAVVCAVALGGVFIGTKVGLGGFQKTLDDLKSRQGEFADYAVEDIQSKMDKNTSKLAGIKDIPIKSSTLELFAYMPALLPQGVWLNSFDARSMNSGTQEKPEPLKWSLQLDGMAYSENPNEEIALVNEFVTNMKKDPHFTKYFTNVNLASLDRKEEGNRVTVSFRLSCN